MNRLIGGFVVFIVLCQSVSGGPIDPYIPSTFRKLIDHTDVVLLAKQVSVIPDREKQRGGVTCTVLRIAKQPQAPVPIKIGDQLRLMKAEAGKDGDLLLLTGFQERDKTIDWDIPTQVTNESYKYILETPNDALFSLADHMSREQLRRSFANPMQPHLWRRWQAVMLGVCGNREDAPLLKRVLDRPRYKRWFNGGAMIGYLLLEGESGLSLLDETRFKNEQASFQDTYAALRAVRCIGNYAPKKIERERLLESMRYMLDRTESPAKAPATWRWSWVTSTPVTARFSCC